MKEINLINATQILAPFLFEGIIIIDNYGFIKTLNQSAVDYFPGATKSQLLNQSIENYIPSPKIPQFLSNKIDMKNIDISIGNNHALVNMHVIDDSEALIILRQVTTINHLNTELQKYQQYLRQFEIILDSLDEGVCFIDNNQKIVLYNKKQGELNSREAKDVQGKYLTEVFSTQSSLVSSLYTLSNTKEIGYSNTFFSNNGKKYSIHQKNIPLLIGKQKIGNIFVTRDFSKTEDFIETLYLRKEEVSKDNTEEKDLYSSFFTNTNALSTLLDELKQLGNPSANLIFHGDQGTGKNMLARFFVENQLKKSVYMINCSLYSTQSLSNMLFGSHDKAGFLEQAHKGALIIDKLTAMPLFLQEHLFNALKTNTIIRNGCEEEIAIDVQIISLLNEKPWKSIKEKCLNENLFYELSSVSFYVPSLQDQQSSIVQLAENFLNMFNTGKKTHSFSPETVNFLENYHFPGNVRQLKHMVEWIVSRHPDVLVYELHHLPEYLQTDTITDGTRTASYSPKIDLAETVEQYEKQIIVDTLKRYNYHLTNTAEQLGISRQNLNYKIKKHEIDSKK
ncbi:PAS domain-containing protein [Sporosarcina sp. PTS2304]|uniref:sigma 54-interacting transcriptional regulator n=1 Tax=Sporosarcina sp. PTS2304 TaxID=2283194 RepID=UPI000E0DB7CE|nr:sigma 54-interacting transcriptional regulator [Sporosarcina sp. PTS2304]AXH99826.1 PAS domain-containing protein [Sporosarcina sp. PTS2304]